MNLPPLKRQISAWNISIFDENMVIYVKYPIKVVYHQMRIR